MGDRLAGKVCIVTGAGSGIGRASVIRFAEEGARVTAVDIDGDAVEETARTVGAAVFAVRADVSVAAEVKAYTDDTVARWGGLHVVFNNAGVNLPGVFHEATDEVIDRTLNVNVKGCIYGCRYAIPHMLAGGGGSLINTTSVNGLVAEPYLAVYATSKGAIVMLSKGIALDYAKQGSGVTRWPPAGSTRRSTTPTPRCSAGWRRCMPPSIPSSRSAGPANPGRSRTSLSSSRRTNRRS